MIAKIALLTLTLSSAANLVLGYVVLFKNPSRNINRLFGLLSLALVGWSTADYLAIIGPQVDKSGFNFLIFRLVFSFVALINLTFFSFISVFPGRVSSKKTVWLSLVSLLGMFVVVEPFLGSFFATYMNGMPVPGPGMMLLMLSLVLFAIGGFVTLGRKLGQLSGQTKNQARYLIVAAVIVWILLPLSDFVLPTFFGINFTYTVSPVLALLFAVTIAYAIIRQRLFDIRPVAARSLSYGLFLLTLVVVYVVAAFGMSRLFTSR